MTAMYVYTSPSRLSHACTADMIIDPSERKTTIAKTGISSPSLTLLVLLAAGRLLARMILLLPKTLSKMSGYKKLFYMSALWASGPTPPLLRPGLLPTPCWRSKSAASASGPEVMSVVCAQFWAIRNTINTM